MKLQVTCMSVLIVTAWTRLSTAQTPTPTATPIDCEAVRCQVQSAIAQCTSGAANLGHGHGNGNGHGDGNGNGNGQGGMNHGQYVSCVAHVLHGLNIPPQCTGAVMRCATHSTFGKSNFETCQIQEPGVCDTTTTPSTCTEGTLLAGLISCATNADCIVTRCRTMRAFPRHRTPTPGADRCSTLNATPGITAVPGTGSCCPSCP